MFAAVSPKTIIENQDYYTLATTDEFDLDFIGLGRATCMFVLAFKVDKHVGGVLSPLLLRLGADEYLTDEQAAFMIVDTEENHEIYRNHILKLKDFTQDNLCFSEWHDA